MKVAESVRRTALMRGGGVFMVCVVAIACDALLFSPSLFNGKLLAVGDGLNESLPALYAPPTLWNPDMLLGYPVYADGSLAQFYPLRLLRLVPDGFNLYVIAPFAICSAALFGYIFDVTANRVAAATSACAFALGGFAMAHIGHPMIDHPMAWATVNLWSLQRFITSRQPLWLAGAAVCSAIAFTSGQPQIGLFSIVLSTAYVISMETPRAIKMRSGLALACALVSIMLGVGLAAFCLIPAAALGSESTRAALSFDDFTQFSVPFERLARLFIFPYATGGGAQSVLAGPFLSGASSPFAETTLYVPAAVIALAACGAVARPRRVALFWCATVIVGLALAAGPELPFATWTYGIYPFNLFRIPGRHTFEITLGLCVLAGIGMASFSAAAMPALRRAALGSGVFAAVAIGAAAVREIGVRDASLLAQPYVTWFVAADTVQGASLLLLLFGGTISIRKRVACVAAAVAGGAVLFAELDYWRDAPTTALLQAPRSVATLLALPRTSGQRMYAYSNDPNARLKPNLPWIWNFPDLAGYTPLQLLEVRRFLHADQGDGKLLDPTSPAVDLAAVRYVAVTAQPQLTMTDAAPFAPPELGIFLSGTSDLAPHALALGLPRGEPADRIVMVSALGAAVQVTQGTLVGTLIVHRTRGKDDVLPLRAGIETAELAYDRPDIAGHVRHARATTYASDLTTTWYRTEKPLLGTGLVSMIELRVPATTKGLLVRKISLIDTAAHVAYPLSEESVFLSNSRHYRHIADIDGIALFENLRARPKTWIDSGRGRIAIDATDPQARDVTAQCSTACVAVWSDVRSADWFVTIDGIDAPVRNSYSILRGVELPPGRHRVRWIYRPRALIEGGIISVISLSAMLISCVLLFARRGRGPSIASLLDSTEK